LHQQRYLPTHIKFTRLNLSFLFLLFGRFFLSHTTYIPHQLRGNEIVHTSGLIFVLFYSPRFFSYGRYPQYLI
jgi:hypothetical protein